jgi:protein involved in polysaccharide export with SLBB domain
MVRRPNAPAIVATVLLALMFAFASTLRAQMDSGGLNPSGFSSGSANSPSAASMRDPLASPYTSNPDADDSDLGPNGGPTTRNSNPQCSDPSDPNAANSGLPPCAQPGNNADGAAPPSDADNNNNSPSDSGGGSSTLRGGSGLDGGLGGNAFGSDAAGIGGLGARFDRQKLTSMMQQLGISPDEIGNLKSEMSSGGLTPDDMQELCLHLASRQVGPNDVAGIGRALGLSFTDTQLDQLRSCTQLSSPSGESNTPGKDLGMQVTPGASGGSQQVSSIEQTFRGLDSAMRPAAPNTRNLQQFGYSIFSQRVSTFAPVSNVPVGNDYVIGPGDQLKMLMWGRINNTLTLNVGRDGSVMIPEIGPLQVAGLTFDQTKKLIEGHAGQITGVQVEVTMGKLRTIQVFVVGEVQVPGSYTVSALSHISNALAASGGITKIGSLRRIELRRGNQVARSIDLYNLLLNGNAQGDEQLEPNDVIFVPVIGPVVGVAGDVKRPAIYELSRNGESLGNVLRLAGGISAFGYSQRVQVERVENHDKRIALDVDLNDMRTQRFDIRDGDLIKVYPVLPEQHDIVMVRGNVNRPGKFQWHQGMRVSELVEAAEGVAPHTFFKYALIRRQVGREKAIHMVPVDLGDALGDHLASPGDVTLMQQDELTVFSESQMKYLPTVQVFGEVRNPGYYVLSQGMRVSDLLYLAGGLRDDAYQKQAELARTEVVNGSHTTHATMDIDLRAALAGLNGVDDSNPQLVPNDQLFVQRASDWHLPWVVQVRGQVARPGPYTIHDGERIASVIERAGGLLPEAYLPATILIRQSIKREQQQRLDEARRRLQAQVAHMQMNPAIMNTSTQQNSQTMQQQAQTLSMVERVLGETEGQQASGRLVIRMRPLDQLANSPDNIALVDQDTITIPRRPAAINVLGQVYNPAAIVFRPGLTTRDYLEQAGGPNQDADADHIMVVKADGSVLTEEGIKQSKRSTMFPLLPMVSGGLMSAQLEPGDTVYVPEKLIYENKMQETATIAQIVANAATGLAVVGILASSL